MPSMQIMRIDHVSLDVRDRPASLAWYETVLGLTPHTRHSKPDEPIFLGPSGARLGLFAERPAGVRHIALATDRLGQTCLAERLDRLHIPYHRERHRDHESIYFRDLDGAMLEVMVPRP
jgi:catechol 2,3-dioxygenase-like lactoylglutathione lyase family enzyme